MEDLIGKQLGQYQIVAPIGEGGMAAVYKAYQPSIERYVALKILPRHYTTEPNFVQRFKQEAKIIASLEHPNILPVHDFGEAEGYTYIVMRYVEGKTLTDLLKGQPFPLTQIVEITSQIASALDYAHVRGVIHRDVKPSNVLLTSQGNCLLSDFGLAKVYLSSTKLTSSGAFIGTPTYASPEQCLGRDNIDGRSDVYSLGVMLYEMATGRPPFDAETPMAVVIKHVHDPLPLPRTLNPGLPDHTEQVILKSLAKQPEDRYQTAGELARALAEGIDHRVEASEPVGKKSPAGPSWVWLAGCLGALGMIGMLITIMLLSISTRPASKPATSSPKNAATATSPPAWAEFLRVQPVWPSTGCGPWELPVQLSTGQSLETSARQIGQAFAARKLGAWRIAPQVDPSGRFAGNVFALYLDLTSLVQGVEWVKMGNTISASVQARSAPDHIDSVEEYPCGAGTGAKRRFPAISLEPKGRYDAETTFAEADYFTLQPGEVEVFVVPFTCTQPGVYTIHIDIPYSYAGETGYISLDSPAEIVCPQSLTLWRGDYNSNTTTFTIQDVYQFTWDGMDYVNLAVTPSLMPAYTLQADFSATAESLTTQLATLDTPAPPKEAPGSAGEAKWPMIHGDPKHWSRLPFAGPAHPDFFEEQSGFFEIGFWPGVAIAADGTRYTNFEEARKAVIAIGADGVEKWHINLEDQEVMMGWVPGAHTPAIGPDGSIYVGCSLGSLFAIAPDGSAKWRFKTSAGVESSAVVGPDGVIYFGGSDGTVYAVHTDGALKWKYSGLGNVTSSPALDDSGRLYVGGEDGNLYAFTPQGSLIWKFAAAGAIRSSPLITEQGIYFGDRSGFLYGLAHDGTMKWSLSIGERVEGSPALGLEGALYVISPEPALLAVSQEGEILWSYRSSNIEDPQEVYQSGGEGATPRVDLYGTIYIPCGAPDVCAIDPSGNFLGYFRPGAKTTPVLTVTMSSSSQAKPSPWPLQSYDLPLSEPYDVVFDGSAIWVLYDGQLVRLELVEAEGRFRAAEQVAFPLASNLAWNTEESAYWAVRGSPNIVGDEIDLVNSAGNILAAGTVPSAFTKYPHWVAWDGENLWTDNGEGTVYKLQTIAGSNELQIRDSYAPGIDRYGISWSSGLEWDGQALWMLVGDGLYRLNDVLRSECVIVLSPNVLQPVWDKWRGIAWDGQYLWVLHTGENRLYRVNPDACR